MKKQGIIRVGTGILFMGCCLLQASANAATGIEEIEVTGKVSGLQLKWEIERLEEGMFALFNELNSTDDFDVTCRDITHAGTLIPTWECEPAYLTKARADNAYEYIKRGTELKDDALLMFENRVKTEQLNVEIRQLALEHPELAKAMLELDARKQSLVEREQRLREEGGFLGLLSKNDEE